jgi:hypothetical protein
MLSQQGVQIAGEVLANRTVIIIKNKRDETCLLTEIAIPSDRNIILQEASKGN